MPQILRHGKINRKSRLEKKKTVVLYNKRSSKKRDAKRLSTILTYLYFIQRAREGRLHTIITYLRRKIAPHRVETVWSKKIDPRRSL